LIMIIVGYKTRCGRPVFMLDSVKKIFGMTLDLAFGSPEPEKKQPDANCSRKATTK